MNKEGDERFFEALEKIVIERPYEEMQKEKAYSYMEQDVNACRYALEIFCDSSFNKYGDLAISINFLGLYLTRIVEEERDFNKEVRNKISSQFLKMQRCMKSYSVALKKEIDVFYEMMENIYLNKYNRG